MEKYRSAYQYYVEKCKKHDIECQINFWDFINSLTLEQKENLLEHSNKL